MAPSLLAFHGFGGNSSELEPMLTRVREAGFIVHARLLPGHGTTPRDLQERRFDEWVSYARAELDRIEREHGAVVVLGFSMGSLVAMELAIEREIAGLIVIGNALTLSAPLRSTFGMLDFLKLRAPDLYVPKPRPADIEDRAAGRKLTSYSSHPFRAAREVHGAGIRLRSEVHRIRARTLILHGRKDHVCPVDNATWLAAQIPHATLRIYPRSAHVVCADFDREELAKDVVTFLGEL
ncbi:alpha/beta fold hydrolase [soil metagenome]